MRLNRGLLNWGVFLIVLGAVPLAVSWRVLDATVARDLIRLWPLILVGLGLGLVLRFTRAAALGGVLAAATMGLLVGSVIAGGWGSFAGACLTAEPGSAALETRSSPFAGDEARLDLELSCARLTVDGQGGADWIVRADFAAGQPSLDMQPARLQLRDRAMGPFGSPRGHEVQLSLPEAPSTIAYLTLNASQASLNPGARRVLLLSGTLNASDLDMRLAEADMTGGPLNMTLNASSAKVVMPGGGIGAQGTVTLNASSLTMCTAPDVGVRIAYDQRLSSDNFAATGLTGTGDTWQTPGFDAATARIDLRVSANVSSITLDRTGGCP